MNLQEKLSGSFAPEVVEWPMGHAQYVLDAEVLPPTLTDEQSAIVLNAKPSTMAVWRSTWDRRIRFTKTGRSPMNSTASVLYALLSSGDNKQKSGVAA
jgi:hypothetical protein